MLQIGGTQSTVNLFKVHYFSLPFNHYLLSVSSDRMIVKRMAEKGQQNRRFFKPILVIYGIITHPSKDKYNLQSKLALCLTLYWLLMDIFEMWWWGKKEQRGVFIHMQPSLLFHCLGHAIHALHNITCKARTASLWLL